MINNKILRELKVNLTIKMLLYLEDNNQLYKMV